jgi:riboflavin synthase
MFTGIIETIGTITRVETTGTNRSFWIRSKFSADFKPDQSIAHNGVCLTVEAVQQHEHRVTAIAETLQKTNLGSWAVGTLVNIERCMLMNGRLDGHIVQGHVDATATCVDVREEGGSWRFVFQFPPQFAHLVIEKGSITINGISLTLVDVGINQFSVAIIPFTYEHTNLQVLQAGDTANIEFDIIGKYISRISQLGGVLAGS